MKMLNYQDFTSMMKVVMLKNYFFKDLIHQKKKISIIFLKQKEFDYFIDLFSWFLAI